MCMSLYHRPLKQWCIVLWNDTLLKVNTECKHKGEPSQIYSLLGVCFGSVLLLFGCAFACFVSFFGI